MGSIKAPRTQVWENPIPIPEKLRDILQGTTNQQNSAKLQP